MMQPTSSSRLRIAFLGSGSAGNATAVSSGSTSVLVDCGFSARETLRRLETGGLSRRSVAAVLLTHEHGDHLRGVEVLARRLDVPVYASPGTLSNAPRLTDRACLLRAGDSFAIGSLRIRVLETSHDAAEPVGYAFETEGGGSFGLVTDTGVMPGETLEALSGCQWVGLESNHDESMLASGPYPRFLKRRIASERGHLSNSAAAEALRTLAEGGTRRIFAMHLSRTNNTPETALDTLRGRAERDDLPLRIDAVVQDRGRLVEEVA